MTPFETTVVSIFALLGLAIVLVPAGVAPHRCRRASILVGLLGLATGASFFGTGLILLSASLAISGSVLAGGGLLALAILAPRPTWTLGTVLLLALGCASIAIRAPELLSDSVVESAEFDADLALRRVRLERNLAVIPDGLISFCAWGGPSAVRAAEVSRVLADERIDFGVALGDIGRDLRSREFRALNTVLDAAGPPQFLLPRDESSGAAEVRFLNPRGYLLIVLWGAGADTTAGASLAELERVLEEQRPLHSFCVLAMNPQVVEQDGVSGPIVTLEADRLAIRELAKKHRVDLVMSAAENGFASLVEDGVTWVANGGPILARVDCDPAREKAITVRAVRAPASVMSEAGIVRSWMSGLTTQLAIRRDEGAFAWLLGAWLAGCATLPFMPFAIMAVRRRRRVWMTEQTDMSTMP